ncbi:DUF3017 domain-containing protein [Thermostaphylospora chromogena]|mgnify:CR=1 FL=1|uniref:DUF3017 domain-containing protein n=1 Tax=Thermostaphylospora chromogena TaxID=35622 RepID=A0A1H1EBD9_9ACTN|nr:DUF3017 domain-containing protein [Thermostaphylospora chromogena]SDQ86043.1 Protein of unknown function [Thermostaphylospora chromogena]
MSERQGAGPYLIVLVGAACGLALVLSGATPVVGVPLMGAFFMLGALCRLILPDRRAGLLAVRNKTVDVITLGVIGAMLIFGGLILLVPREWIIG